MAPRAEIIAPRHFVEHTWADGLVLIATSEQEIDDGSESEAGASALPALVQNRWNAVAIHDPVWQRREARLVKPITDINTIRDGVENAPVLRHGRLGTVPSASAAC
jgi:hypothetical protein